MNEFDLMRNQAKRYKAMYPAGTRIMLLHMGDDPRPVEDNTRGTVNCVDDIGTVHLSLLQAVPEASEEKQDYMLNLTPKGSSNQEGVELPVKVLTKSGYQIAPPVTASTPPIPASTAAVVVWERRWHTL